MPAANLIVILGSTGGGLPAPTDNLGGVNTYTFIVYGSANRYSYVSYMFNPTVSASHTFSISDVNPAIAVLAFSGAASSPLDQSAGNGVMDSGNLGVHCVQVTPGNITPTTSGQLLVAGLCTSVVGNAITPSLDSGFTTDGYLPTTSNANGIGYGHFVQSVAAAINPDWTWPSIADSAQACIASFKGSGWTLVAHSAASSTNGTSVTTSPIDTTGGGAAVVPFIPGRRRSPFLIRRKLYVKTG